MKLVRITRTTIINPEQILSVNYLSDYNCIEITLNASRRLDCPIIEIYPRNWLHRKIIYNRIMNAMGGH